MSDREKATLERGPLRVSDAVTLRRWTLDDAEPLFQLVDENREFLREWLPWVDSIQSAQDESEFLRRQLAAYSAGSALGLALEVDQELGGNVSFAWIDLRSHAAEIGYWVAERHTRRGVMTSACRALIEHAFGPLELRRIVIRAATGNRPSCAIPERLGFQLEGVEREAELLHGAYVDLARYAKLRHDWAP